MPSDQSNSVREAAGTNAGTNRVTGLLVPWDRTGPGPAHERLAAALRAQVNDGRLRPGDRLPPTRTLADDLGLSRWVITQAYDQLKAEGYLTGRVGSGTLVAGPPDLPDLPRRPDSRQLPPVPHSPAVPRSPALPDVAAGTTRPGTPARSQGGPTSFRSAARQPASAPGTPVPAPPDPFPALPDPFPALPDLSPALPDLTSFPRAAWRSALVRALATASDADLGYPDPAGAPALRATMATYLRRVRGIDTDPARVSVTQGVRHAVGQVCRALRAAGAVRIAVEDPSWPRMRDAARGSGLEVVPVRVDGDGMRVEDLEGAGVDAAFVTPTHQFPTGVPLSAQRRLALIDWARAASGRMIIEDDYDAEFRYDRRPVGALAARAPDRVVYLGSASKTLGPGVHLGWMVVPDVLREGVSAARDVGLVPTVDQLAFVDLLTSGAYDRHLRRMRRLYQQRRGALLAALTAAAVPGHPAPSMSAGLHVLWYLPADVDESRVLAAAASAGLVLLGLAQCRIAPGPPGLVLGYGNLPDHLAPAVAAALTRALVRPPAVVRAVDPHASRRRPDHPAGDAAP